MKVTCKDCIKMNKKLTITFVVITIASISGISLLIVLDHSKLYLAKTNPIHFTNLDYDDAIHAQYPTVNPSEIRQMASAVIYGTIKDIEINSVLMTPIDPEIVDKNGVVIEPKLMSQHTLSSSTKQLKENV